MFFYSLDASHSEEQTASGVDSVNDESTDECWDSESAVSGSDTDSEYVPTPERPVTLKVSRTDLPNEVAFMEVYQQEKFVCPVLGVTVGLSMCMTAYIAQCPIKRST